ncbi:hypothetical protein GGG16DRAFT_106888, partial [Schizophyllum commune]
MEQQLDRVQLNHHLEFRGFFLGLLGFVTRDQSLEATRWLRGMGDRNARRGAKVGRRRRTAGRLSIKGGRGDSYITSVTVYNALSTPTVDAASAGFIPGPRARPPTNTTATGSLLAPVTRPSDLVLPYETDPSRLGSRAPSQAIYTLTDTFAPIRALSRPYDASWFLACLGSSTTATTVTTATTTRENVERGLCAQRGRRRAAEDERGQRL